MRELKTCQVALLEDRNILKWRVNFVEGNRMFGFIIPIKSN
jgi:hypothetical protein